VFRFQGKSTVVVLPLDPMVSVILHIEEFIRLVIELYVSYTFRKLNLRNAEMGFTSLGISELEPPFNNPLYSGLSGTRSLKLSTLTLYHHNPRIPEPQFDEMIKHTSSISFVFRDFITSSLECSAPYQWECRKPNSQNPDKYSIASSDF
jgi:hypothetical protein